MKTELWAIPLVAAVIVAGAVAAVYLNSRGQSTSTITAPQFPGYHAIAIDSNGALGIDLSLALNSTTISLSQGQDLQSVVQVLNTYSRVNNVSVADDFPVKPLQAKCNPGDYNPVVIQMYEGNYDKSNISSATPLQYVLTCPAVFPNSIVDEYYYLFQPNSADATLYGRTEAGSPANTGPMSLYLVNQISIHQFSTSFPNGIPPTGVYTLMLEDFWGQMVVLNFTITP